MVPSTALRLVTAGAFLVVLKGVEIDGNEFPLSRLDLEDKRAGLFAGIRPPEIESYRPGVTKP
jgi:hypothetical protein